MPLSRRAFLLGSGFVATAAALAPITPLERLRRFWPGFSAARDIPLAMTEGLPFTGDALTLQGWSRYATEQRTMLGLPVQIAWSDGVNELPPQDLPGRVILRSGFDMPAMRMATEFPVPAGAVGARVYTTSYRRDRNGQVIPEYHLLGAFDREQIERIVAREDARLVGEEAFVERNRVEAIREDAIWMAKYQGQWPEP